MKTIHFSQLILVVTLLLTACTTTLTPDLTTTEPPLPATPSPSPIPSQTLTPTTEPTSADVTTLIPATTQPRPSNTPIPQLPSLPEVTSNACPGTQPSLLMPGRQGRVSNTTPDPNRVRSEPSAQSDLLGEIPAGATFDVLEGPNCIDDAAWFKVRYENIEGWMKEGTPSEYWVMPILTDARDVAGPAVSAAGLTLNLPPELGTAAQIQDVQFNPAVNTPPATLISLPEYPYYDRSPSIYIYSVQEYLYYRPDLRLRLEGIRSAINFLMRGMPADLPDFRDTFLAGQTTLLQAGSFNGGWGLHAVAVSADTEDTLYYIFMGFTSDMSTLIYVRLPIRLAAGQLVGAVAADFDPPLDRIDTILDFTPIAIRPATTPTIFSATSPCPGAPPTMLSVGDWVMVSLEPPLPLRLRSAPDEGTIVGEAQPGENLLVIGGPDCVPGYTYWKVRTLDGLEGWAAEGNNNNYFMVDPLSAWYPLPAPLSGGRLQRYDLREIYISASSSLVTDISGGYSPASTPIPPPANDETPMPEGSCASDFSATFCAEHSAYGITSDVFSLSYMVVFDLQDPLTRYYLDQPRFAECSDGWLQNLAKDPASLANIQPFCGMGQGIPVHWIADVQSIQFNGGRGLRFLIASANDLTAGDMEYIFQGLSDDGRYYILVHLGSIYHPYIVDGFILATQDFGPLLEWDAPYDEAQASYDTFNQRILTLLNAHLIPLYPQLDLLDEMIASIEVK